MYTPHTHTHSVCVYLPAIQSHMPWQDSQTAKDLHHKFPEMSQRNEGREEGREGGREERWEEKKVSGNIQNHNE